MNGGRLTIHLERLLRACSFSSQRDELYSWLE